MGGHLSLTVLEIVVLMMGATVLGVTIHFFITSTKAYKRIVDEAPGGKLTREISEWKLKYFNENELRIKETEIRDRELTELRQKLSAAEENADIYAIEADETRQENKRLKAEIEKMRLEMPPPSVSLKNQYYEQIQQAQQSLKEHQERINTLLRQIEAAGTTERRQEELQLENEGLHLMVRELKSKLAAKEREAGRGQQQQQLTTEMNSLLDGAYSQFNVLKEKIVKLEAQLGASKKSSLELVELQEENYKLTTETEDLRKKQQVLTADKAELENEVTELHVKLKEANFDRQQLQKKVAFLEEIKTDMEVVAATNKKLESQIKRIGELESMLSIMSGEAQELARKS